MSDGIEELKDLLEEGDARAADALPALIEVAEAYRTLHSQACDDHWAEDECACGGRQLLAALNTADTPEKGES